MRVIYEPEGLATEWPDVAAVVQGARRRAVEALAEGRAWRELQELAGGDRAGELPEGGAGAG